MRFFADGPSLPDELLLARDEGNVLFFCGAGLSRAKAHLPGFFELAEQVLRELRPLPDSPVRKLFRVAQDLQKQHIDGIGSVLAADRIFGLLERGFAIADIERAVGLALKPKPNADISAHRILLDLSRTSTGDVQLVTTNFDRLFSVAAPKMRVWTPNQLPDISRNKTFQGIVHLHGIFDEDYCRPLGGNLILSSAEFGRAYLAEGWATRFIRDAIAKYSIVFVGYSADDPPVQYLLEALSRLGDKSHKIYAFQDGREDTASALWTPKGVAALAYAPENNHAALWRTLEAWAQRARNPAEWRKRVIRSARKGPDDLKPFECGQVIHLAMTDEGASAIAAAEKPIPASWLCVFDPSLRYGKLGHRNLYEAHEAEIDPFVLWGLDTDVSPPPIDPHDTRKRREVPAEAINVLASSAADHVGARRAGLWSSESELPPRLISLALWLTKVCHQPAAIWWAAGQPTLHPVIQRLINSHFAQNRLPQEVEARKAWRYILNDQPLLDDVPGTRAYSIIRRIETEGWAPVTRRAFADVSRPVLSTERPYGSGPPIGRVVHLSEVVRLDVKYVDDIHTLKVSDQELVNIIPIFRRNLELAAELEAELSPYALDHIPSLEKDETDRERFYEIGLDALVRAFVRKFSRLIAYDMKAAKRETLTWNNDSVLFGRLLIWAAGVQAFLSDQEASDIFLQTSDRVFWGGHHQRDLLIVLARRWSGLDVSARLSIEQRMIKGRPRWWQEGTADYKKRKAYTALERLHWLTGQGCTLSFDLTKLTERLQKIVPDWSPPDSKRAIENWSPEGGQVITDTSCDFLADIPLSALIAAAFSGRRHEFGALLDYDPYAGLCKIRPVRLLAALARCHEQETSRIAWSQFLHSGARSDDKNKLSGLIAWRLISLPDDTLLPIVSAAASWLARSSEKIFLSTPEGARSLVDRLASLIRENPDSEHVQTRMPHGNEKWLTAAWNSAAGDLITALLHDTYLKGLTPNSQIPEPWTKRCESILDLPRDNGRYALAILAQKLSWFYSRDEAWSERNILGALDRGGLGRVVFVAGLMGNAHIEGQKLFARLKPLLLELSNVGTQKERETYDNLLAGILSSAWRLKDGEGHRWVTDQELQAALVVCSQDMRRQILWQMRSWNYDESAYFIEHIWPLQLSVRSQATTNGLIEIALKQKENFPEMIKLILPYLNTVDHGTVVYSLAHGSDAGLVEQYPASVLSLMKTILPKDRSKWPYDADGVVRRLEKLDPPYRF